MHSVYLKMTIFSWNIFQTVHLTTALFCWIRKDSRYTEKDAAVVVRQMLKVAAECHLHGLVHRDMKPEVLPILSYG
jgi:serine/threonine protein kinase